jgi:hypothetical protein
MRKILIIILLAFSLSGWGAIYYISPTGDNGTGNGTNGTPWQTWAYAITQATAGDTIYAQAGTYTLTATVEFPVGITATGTGVTSIITAASDITYFFSFVSATENTNGNQSVYGLAFAGDSLTQQAIFVHGRGNVRTHDCTFSEFLTNAVRLTGRVAASDGPPVTAAEDNLVYNNTFIECGSEVYSAPYYYASAAISLGGQKDARIYGNTINNNTGNYAYGINTNNQGYNAGCWIYNNNIYTSPRRMDTYQWNFAIELWNNRGGMIVRDNFVTGSIDFGGYSTTDSAAYGFAALCEHNKIIQPALQAYPQTGIIIESDVSGGVQVRRNYIKYCSTGIGLNLLSGPTDVQSDVTIAYNIISETLTTAGNYSGRGINHGTAVSGATVNRLKIFNNVFYANTYVSSAGIHFASAGVKYNDFEYRNNIFYKQYNSIRFENDTVSGLDATNNLFYLHTNAFSYVSATVTDSITIPRTYGDPLFRSSSDLHLQSTSPAINAGIDVSATTGGLDFHGASLYGAAYDIGAFEYGVGRLMILNDTIMPTINYKIPLIDH